MFNISNSARRIIRNSQKVYVNNSLSNIIKCTNINNSSSASFIIPVERFDSVLKTSLHNSQVAVMVNNVYLFNGFIDTSTAKLTANEDGFSFEAKSVLQKLEFSWVGQNDNKNYVYYARAENELIDVLRDLFNDLPNGLDNVIKLGNTAVIQGKSFDFGDILIFRNNNYTNALDSILSYCGDVAYTPRFTSWGCYIDFYRINNNSNGTSFARVADYGDDAVFANVASLDESVNSTDRIDKVTVYGSPEKFIISVYSNPAIDYSLRLIPDWDENLEEIVKLYPDCASQNSPTYVSGAEFVYKRYRVPYCLLLLTPLGVLPIEKQVINQTTEDGTLPEDKKTYYNLQAYQWKTTPSLNTTSTSILDYTYDTNPTLVEAKFDLANGYVYFNNPTLNDINYEITTLNGNQVPKITREIAHVGITVAYENPDHLCFYTTPSSVKYPNSKTILREDWTKVTYTNIDKPFANNTVFDNVTIFWEDVFPSVSTVVNTKQTIKDDTAKIQSHAYEVLKEKRFTSKTVSVEIPFVTNHYKVGNRLMFDGLSDYNNDNLAITSVTFDLESYNTSFEANNIKPLKFTDASF